jgi:pentatricopeptide repeat protein
MDAYGTIEPVDVKSMEKVFGDLEQDRNVQVQGGHWAAMINTWGGVKKDLDKAISIFESIQTHPSTKDSSVALPDAISFEALINVFVVHRRTDLISEYIHRLKSMGIHMTAYIANCLIRGYAAVGDLEEARSVFDSLLDPPEGVAAPNNHAPHEPLSVTVPATAPVYREVRTMFSNIFHGTQVIR